MNVPRGACSHGPKQHAPLWPAPHSLYQPLPSSSVVKTVTSWSRTCQKHGKQGRQGLYLVFGAMGWNDVPTVTNPSISLYPRSLSWTLPDVTELGLIDCVSCCFLPGDLLVGSLWGGEAWQEGSEMLRISPMAVGCGTSWSERISHH